MEWWDSAQCAEYLKIAKSTWRSYVSTGYAPLPHTTRNPRTGHLRWSGDTVRAWAPNRPGQGARTDLLNRKS